MIFRHPIARSLLVVLPLAVCAARAHGFGMAAPRDVTQEVNRCLIIVRVAATSRHRRAGRGYEVTTKSNLAALPLPESCTASRSAAL